MGSQAGDKKGGEREGESTVQREMRDARAAPFVDSQDGMMSFCGFCYAFTYLYVGFLCDAVGKGVCFCVYRSVQTGPGYICNRRICLPSATSYAVRRGKSGVGGRR